MRRREKSRFFRFVFCRSFLFIKKHAVKGTLFSENIEGKKINGNEWLLMMDHFSKRDLFGKCEKMIMFFFVLILFHLFDFTFFFFTRKIPV